MQQGHVSTRVTQFAYFNEALNRPRWKGRKILDFGGNVGNFLMSANGNVDHEDYWCMDVNAFVVERGRSQFPRAHFVHWDRYSSEYNPNGTRRLPVPDCGVPFDLILAFSVATHLHESDMLEIFGSLQTRLAPGGLFAFTFTDPRYDRSLSDQSLPPGTGVRHVLEMFRNKNTDDEIARLVEKACQARWCVVIDEDVYAEPGPEISQERREGRPWESYCVYYTTEYMQSLFPQATIIPPVKPEWQYCCVLKSD